GIEGRQAGYLDRVAPGAVLLADDEALLVALAVLVVPAGHAVARRTARHRPHLGGPAGVQRTEAWYLDGLGPGAVLLADDESLPVTMAVDVAAAGRAAACRRARHRVDPAARRGQGGQAGYLDRLAPGAVPLAGHEALPVSLAILEVPSGPAVAGREARHRGDPGRSAGIERRYAGRLGRLAPGAVSLAGHERLSVPQAVLVEAAGDAVTRRARHR